MVPDGWRQLQLIDMASKISDGIHSTPKYVETSDYYFINGNNLKDGKIVINKITKCISEEEFQKHQKDLNDRTILMSINGTIGNLAYYRGEKVILGKSAAYINLKNSVNKDFIYFVLSSAKTRRFFESELTGTTIRNLSLKSINTVKLLTPPFPEQKRIAHILSTWDKAIETVKKLIENSKAQKKALMQQLLTGKRRLPGFNGAWKETAVKNMGKIISGGTPNTNTKEFWEGEVLWMTPTDVTALKNRFISDTKRKITKSGVENSSATLMPKGSLLVCTRATVGLMSISTSEITTNQGFKSIIPNAKYDVDFLYSLFNFFKNKFISFACGSTFLELSKKDFAKLYFMCPSLVEQQRIASVLITADKEIETLQQKLDCLKQEKKALMQQLLTGKRRVNVDSEDKAYA